MKKIKIAFFIDALKEDLDGVSITSHHIISRLPDSFEAIVFTALPPKSDDFPYKVYTTRSLTVPYARDYKFAFPNRKRIFKILDEFEPDLIHWSTPTLLGKCAVNYSTSRGVPNLSIYHAHFHSYLGYVGWLPSFVTRLFQGYLNKWLLKFYKKANKLLAPTVEMEDYLKSIGLKSDKLKVWGRGVDYIRFNPEKRQENYYADRGIPHGKKVLFVSRLVHYKETDMLIKLSHILPKNTQLIIVGDGPESETMEKECSSSTFFLGRIEGEELAILYASSEVFVFPSISETFGNVVNEAMSSGLPVIAADGGGPKNIITHNENGFLVKAKDENIFSDKIKEILTDSDLSIRIGQNARSYAEKIGWDMMVGEIIKEYQTVADIK